MLFDYSPPFLSFYSFRPDQHHPRNHTCATEPLEDIGCFAQKQDGQYHRGQRHETGKRGCGKSAAALDPRIPAKVGESGDEKSIPKQCRPLDNPICASRAKGCSKAAGIRQNSSANIVTKVVCTSGSSGFSAAAFLIAEERQAMLKIDSLAAAPITSRFPIKCPPETPAPVFVIPCTEQSAKYGCKNSTDGTNPDRLAQQCPREKRGNSRRHTGQYPCFKRTGSRHAVEQKKPKQKHAEERFQHHSENLPPCNQLERFREFPEANRNQEQQRKRHADGGNGKHAQLAGDKPRRDHACSRESKRYLLNIVSRVSFHVFSFD